MKITIFYMKSIYSHTSIHSLKFTTKNYVFKILWEKSYTFTPKKINLYFINK